MGRAAGRRRSLRTGDASGVAVSLAGRVSEVFARENGGFDAIVGNPPFWRARIRPSLAAQDYPLGLQTLHRGRAGNADFVAHFFRRALWAAPRGGVFGLIATNTIGQGDTRASGLATICEGWRHI